MINPHQHRQQFLPPIPSSFNHSSNPPQLPKPTTMPIKPNINPKNNTTQTTSGCTLNFNPHLRTKQIQDLISMLRIHKDAFNFQYQDMHGIHPNTYTHHIYIE